MRVRGSPPALTVVVVLAPNNVDYVQPPLASNGVATAYFGDANTPNGAKFTILALPTNDPALVTLLRNTGAFTVIPSGRLDSTPVVVYRKR